MYYGVAPRLTTGSTDNYFELQPAVVAQISLDLQPPFRHTNWKKVFQLCSMGIQGLTSYIGEHKEFFTDLQLRNTDVVIDGNNLYHRLYFDSNLDTRHGGDYDSFTTIVHKFFQTLTVCNIQPYVVLDGGCDASDKKLTTIKERAREKIQAASSLSCGGGGSVLPLLVREVFKQILAKLHVPFVQSFSEADREIVSLANHLSCPVLTLDSDFCIFDLHAGYCPLNYFQWHNLCRAKDSQDCYIPARRFSLEKFCNHFSNMNRSLLPLFAVMTGNDYINLPAVERFLSKVHLPVGSSQQKSRKHVRIRGLLNWLSRFADPAEAIENVLNYVKKHEEEETRQLLASFMEEYKPSSVHLQDFFQKGVYESEEAKTLELPQWVLDAFAKGLLAPFVSDALVLRRTILHVQVENMQRCSAHATALPIRQVIYGLLLNTPPSSRNTLLNKQPTSTSPIFREFDRIQKALKKSFVQAAVLSDNFCASRYSLTTLNKVSLTDRTQLLLDTLGVTSTMLGPIPCLLQLPLAVTCYWIKYSEPRVKLQHMKALLLGVVFGELEKTLNTSDSEASHVEINKIVYEQFCKWKEKKPQKELLELDAAHIFCQWQCCLQMGLYLNQLLCNPLPEPELSRLYCGTLVHRLYHELKSTSTPEDLISTSPKLYQLYCNMMHVVKDATPVDVFQKKSRKHRKQTKQTSDHVLHERESTPLEAVPSCSINNRFATLMTNN